MADLNATPTGERLQIGIFGAMNAGKSSVLNALTRQDLAIVSPVRGTTTDPVSKAMEIVPLGPVVFIDTPGLDDTGEIGSKRVAKAQAVLSKVHLALIVVDSTVGITTAIEDLLQEIEKRKLPYLLLFNKWDLPHKDAIIPAKYQSKALSFSALTHLNLNEVLERLSAAKLKVQQGPSLLSGIVRPLDTVLLVVPIDAAAPQGRLILPQQQVLRGLLDIGALGIIVKDTELGTALARFGSMINLVITDSQVFGKVNKLVPSAIALTSFSILFARYKGNLAQLVAGAHSLDTLKDGDKVLIAEGCTHRRQCGDIGTVKLPQWLSTYTQKQLDFAFTSGGDFPLDLTPYSLIIHCGACMLGRPEMQERLRQAREQGIPMTNYGVTIAHIHGILPRVLSPFALS